MTFVPSFLPPALLLPACLRLLLVRYSYCTVPGILVRYDTMIRESYGTRTVLVQYDTEPRAREELRVRLRITVRTHDEVGFDDITSFLPAFLRACVACLSVLPVCAACAAPCCLCCLPVLPCLRCPSCLPAYIPSSSFLPACLCSLPVCAACMCCPVLPVLPA